MRNFIFFVLILVFLFTGCASNPSTVEKSQISTYKENDSDTQKLQVTEERQNPNYSDWKYKGFGQELPLWIDDAVFKNDIPELKNIDKVIVKCKADNLDQSEKMLEIESKKYENFYLYDSFWVKMKDKKNKNNYVSIAIFTKQNLKVE